MPLSDDKKAMLRLLAQGGQSYEDIAALMGLSVEEVHARVREAVAELEAEGIPAPAIPPPSGVSAAEPSTAPRPTPPPERPSEPAAAPPSEPIPKAKPATKPKATPSTPSRQRRERPSVALPQRREARIGLAVAAAAVVAVALILLLSGGDGSSDDTGASTPATTAANEGKELTKAVLGSVDGSEASGVAVFGRVKNRLALQIAANGLQPTGKTDAYTVWLAASPQKMLPLASTQVGKDGRINAQVEVPTEVLAYLADETFAEIAVTRTSKEKLQPSLEAASSKKEAPAYTGTPVLRGAVTGPIVGAAKK